MRWFVEAKRTKVAIHLDERHIVKANDGRLK